MNIVYFTNGGCLHRIENEYFDDLGQFICEAYDDSLVTKNTVEDFMSKQCSCEYFNKNLSDLVHTIVVDEHLGDDDYLELEHELLCETEREFCNNRNIRKINNMYFALCD